MFPRIATVKQGNRTYRYLQIVEAYRRDGRTTQRVVANLGRLDQLDGKLDDLLASLSRYAKRPFVRDDQIGCRQALPWGSVLLARHLWDQMQLGEIIGKLCRWRRYRFDVAETAFVLVANRLCEPRSEHGLARWLEHTFVCDAKGKRWKPDWLPAHEITKQQRVKVKHEQLNQWYRTLDALLSVKEQIEEGLYLRVRDLFSVKVDLVFYDLTSTYFCRKSPVGELRRHGHSKDGKPRQVQVILGVVMANGFPIAHHVFEGNRAEKTTLEDVLTDVDQRFGLGHVMVVADRGLLSPDNFRYLSGSKFRYLLGLPGRRCAEAVEVLEALDEAKWQRVDKENLVQEIRLPKRTARYFVIDSLQRRTYEQTLRQRSMQRARQVLEKVSAAVEAGRLKDPAKIGARAARAAAKHHGYRYYSYEVPGPGRFRFYEDPQKMQAETLHEGKYILKTDDQELGPAEAVGGFKELATVESGFRDLKDVIEMRPVYHKTDERIEAHIFVATLALFLKRSLEHQLACVLPELSGTEAIAAMRSIGLAELDFNGHTTRLVSGGARDARRVLKALGITDLNPPPSRKGAAKPPETAM
ncbi:MAG: IS1634 family transposase [Acidiferrobacterales bacterium]